MNWLGLFYAMMASWCAVDIGIAIKEKDTRSIIFNAAFMIFEWTFILFNLGV